MEKYEMEINSPLVFILGPTGSGKTKVSLEIAKALKGEIINSDAFSLYKGCDILTTKATFEERSSIPHHMIDILSIAETEYKIINYTKDCSDAISMITDKKCIPIIVGGTNYYVESILFEKVNSINYIDEDENKNKEEVQVTLINTNKIIQEILPYKKEFTNNNFSEDDKIDLFNKKINQYLNSIDQNLLSEILQQVDPDYFKFLHKNDTRRIKNAIIYFFAYDQKKSYKLSKEYIKLKYNNSVIIFLEPVCMDQFCLRLENRVDQILNEGGLVEIFKILNFFYLIHKEDLENHFTHGVLQAIGYKEFYPLFIKLQLHNGDDSLFQSGNEIIKLIKESNLEDLFSQCRRKHITNTIKYAKSQLKFIKKRILPYISKKRINHFRIEDFTNESYKEYIDNALEFINKKDYCNIDREELLNNKDDKLNKYDKEIEINEIQEKLNKISLWEKFTCDICKIELNGNYEYNSHLKSNKHKKKKRNIKLSKNNNSQLN